MNVRNVVLVLCFCFFLYPISSFTGLSVNYSFFLFPVLGLLLSKKIYKPRAIILIFIAFYVTIFFLASIYQYEFVELGYRRVVSFFIFLGMFLFIFVNIEEKMIKAFVLASILISIYFSSLKIIEFHTHGGASLYFEAKSLVGGSRFGFIYLLGFWNIIFLKVRSFAAGFLKKSALLIVLFGIFLTFSRASIIALITSIIIYLFLSLKNNQYGVFRLVKFISVISIFIALTSYLLSIYFPVVITYFDVNLFSLLLEKDLIKDRLTDQYSSEGLRIALWKNIFSFIYQHPLTGSGYLGYWILEHADLGSTHNQYMDTFFRTGFIGISIYMYILFRIGKYLYLHYLYLFIGYTGVLAYGLFQETFKESQGLVVLAFLVGITFRTVNRSLRGDQYMITNNNSDPTNYKYQHT